MTPSFLVCLFSCVVLLFHSHSLYSHAQSWSSSTGEDAGGSTLLLLTVEFSFNLNPNEARPNGFAEQVQKDLSNGLNITSSRIIIESFGNATQVVNGASVGMSMVVSFYPSENEEDRTLAQILESIQSQFIHGGPILQGVYTKDLKPGWLVVISTGYTITFSSSTGSTDNGAASTNLPCTLAVVASIAAIFLAAIS